MITCGDKEVKPGVLIKSVSFFYAVELASLARENDGVQNLY